MSNYSIGFHDFKISELNIKLPKEVDTIFRRLLKEGIDAEDFQQFIKGSGEQWFYYIGTLTGTLFVEAHATDFEFEDESDDYKFKLEFSSFDNGNEDFIIDLDNGENIQLENPLDIYSYIFENGEGLRAYDDGNSIIIMAVDSYRNLVKKMNNFVTEMDYVPLAENTTIMATNEDIVNGELKFEDISLTVDLNGKDKIIEDEME